MSPVDRRLLLRGATALGAGALLAGGVPGTFDLMTGSRPTGRAGAAVADGGPLRIRYLPITDASPLLVAHAQGRFAAAGIATTRPVLFRGWASLAQAFVAGEVDV